MTPLRILPLLLILVSAALATAAPAAPPLLTIDGQPTESILVHPSRAIPDRTITEPPMLARLNGIADLLRDDRLNQFIQSCGSSIAPRKQSPADPPWAYLTLIAADSARTLALFHTEQGELIAFTDPIDPSLPGLRFKPGRLESLISPALAYRGNFTLPPGIELGTLTELTRPYQAAEIQVNRKSLTSRFFRGLNPPPPTSRELGRDPIFIRLPKNYNPRTPSGLIVWINPADQLGLLPSLDQAFDDTGFIVVAAGNCGNNREPSDRLQLALDALATAQSRFFIDPARIYTSGFSGGGKIATILWAGAPELFAGCIPVGGTGWSEDTPVEHGKVWPKLFGKPSPESLRLMRADRYAPITGSDDFNLAPTLAAVKHAANDGINHRLFNINGLAHALPPPGDYLEALQWTDEPARTRFDSLEQRGRDLYPPTPDEASLINIMREAPWSTSAWKAWDQLQSPPTHPPQP